MADLVTAMFDPGVDVEGWPEARVVQRCVDVCRPHALTAAAVAIFPRRLSEADAAERAADKKMARKVGHRLYSVVPAGTWEELRAEAASDMEARQRAAVVRWDEWLPAVGLELEELQVFCSTWVLRQNLLSDVRRIVARIQHARQVIR